MKLNARKRLIASAPAEVKAVGPIPRWHTGDQPTLDSGLGGIGKPVNKENDPLPDDYDADAVGSDSW